MLTIGVEEEFLVVDPRTRGVRPRAERVRRAASDAGDEADAELHRSQVEIGSGVCETLDDVRRDLVARRRAVADAARRVGSVVAAGGTHPFSDWRDGGVTPKPAYLRLEHDYAQLVHEAVVCGCHVHVGIADRDEAVQVMNAVRPWLPAILALSANSPFWLGEDTGYASWRAEVWRRWPLAGTPHTFASAADYDAFVQLLLDTGSIDDPARIYWDVRPSARLPTLEFRVADVCQRVDEAVMIAGLVRALAETCRRRTLAGVPAAEPRPELLRLAGWRGARFGTDGTLLDVTAGRTVPAADLVRALLRFVDDVLQEQGERDIVTSLVERTLAEGTGAVRQRRAYERAGRLEDVVDLLVAEAAAV